MNMIGVKVRLIRPEDFLLVKETLTRIGIPSTKSKVLYQTAHILHKRGEYYICHFKELFLLDNKTANIVDGDLERRNLIVKLLVDWGLVELIDDISFLDKAPVKSIKIVPFKEKQDWTLESKYNIGVKK